MNDLGPIPAHVVEAGNGATLVLLAAMMISAFVYFLRELARLRRRRDGILELLQATYVEGKAAWAISVLAFGLFLRVGISWWIQHVENHGGKIDPALQPLVLTLLMFSYVPLLWGAVCWIRVVMPLSCPRWPRVDAALRSSWLVLAAVALAFGIAMAA
jgi:uncharacterized membrane protein